MLKQEELPHAPQLRHAPDCWTVVIAFAATQSAREAAAGAAALLVPCSTRKNSPTV